MAHWCYKSHTWRNSHQITRATKAANINLHCYRGIPTLSENRRDRLSVPEGLWKKWIWTSYSFFNLMVLKSWCLTFHTGDECLKLVLGTNQSHFVQIHGDIFWRADGILMRMEIFHLFLWSIEFESEFEARTWVSSVLTPVDCQCVECKPCRVTGC